MRLTRQARTGRAADRPVGSEIRKRAGVLVSEANESSSVLALTAPSLTRPRAGGNSVPEARGGDTGRLRLPSERRSREQGGTPSRLQSGVARRRSERVETPRRSGERSSPAAHQKSPISEDARAERCGDTAARWNHHARALEGLNNSWRNRRASAPRPGPGDASTAAHARNGASASERRMPGLRGAQRAAAGREREGFVGGSVVGAVAVAGGEREGFGGSFALTVVESGPIQGRAWPTHQLPFRPERRRVAQPTNPRQQIPHIVPIRADLRDVPQLPERPGLALAVPVQRRAVRPEHLVHTP